MNDGSLDRQLALDAGKDPVDITWRISVEEEGDYNLNIDVANTQGLEDLILTSDSISNSLVLVNGARRSAFNSFGEAAVGTLRGGEIYDITISSFDLASSEKVSGVRFELSGQGSKKTLEEKIIPVLFDKRPVFFGPSEVSVDSNGNLVGKAEAIAAVTTLFDSQLSLIAKNSSSTTIKILGATASISGLAGPVGNYYNATVKFENGIPIKIKAPGSTEQSISARQIDIWQETAKTSAVGAFIGLGAMVLGGPITAVAVGGNVLYSIFSDDIDDFFDSLFDSFDVEIQLKDKLGQVIGGAIFEDGWRIKGVDDIDDQRAAVQITLQNSGKTITALNSTISQFPFAEDVAEVVVISEDPEQGARDFSARAARSFRIFETDFINVIAESLGKTYNEILNYEVSDQVSNKDFLIDVLNNGREVLALRRGEKDTGTSAVAQDKFSIQVPISKSFNRETGKFDSEKTISFSADQIKLAKHDFQTVNSFLIFDSTPGLGSLLVGDSDSQSINVTSRLNEEFRTLGPDYIFAGGGIDIVVSGSGNDFIFGGEGNDRLSGESDDDVILGQDDNDVIFGGAGDDLLIGGGGEDTIQGGSDDDFLDGGIEDNSKDFLYGNAGVDQLYGRDGDDFLYGGDNSDRLFGGEGIDRLFGGEGEFDRLSGGGGNDIIDGGDGFSDIAIYSGRCEEYEITFNDEDDSFKVRHLAEDGIGVDGEDTLFDVEILEFQGGQELISLELDSSGKFIGCNSSPMNLYIIPDSISVLEGDSGISSTHFELIRTGNLSEPLTLSYSVVGSGEDPAESNDFIVRQPIKEEITSASSTISTSGQELEVQFSLNENISDTLVSDVSDIFSPSRSINISGSVTLSALPSKINVAYVIDVSGSTADGVFSQNAGIGDLNGDGDPDEIIDAQIAALEDLTTSLARSEFSSQIQIGIIPFSGEAELLSVFSANEGSEISSLLRTFNKAGIDDSDITVGNGVVLDGGTNFEAALNSTISFFEAEPSLSNFVFFLSDGDNTRGGDFGDEVSILLEETGLDAEINVFPVGDGSSVDDLDLIDDGLNNDSVTDEDKLLNPNDLNTAISQPNVTAAGIREVQILQDGRTIQTIPRGELVPNSQGGFDFSTEIINLDPDVSHEIEAKVVSTDASETFAAASRNIQSANSIASEPISGQVTFAPGESSITITVGVAGDTVVENDESFEVVLSNVPDTYDYVDLKASGLITNDDIDKPVAPKLQGRSKGEPHLSTFDGVGYSFQGAGEFTLVEGNDLNVQIRYLEIDSRVTVASAVATEVEGRKVVIDSNGVNFQDGRPSVTRSVSGTDTGPTITIDDQVITLADNSEFDIGNSRLYRRGSQYTVVFAGEDGIINDGDDQLSLNYFRPGTINIVDVFLDDDSKGQVQGLLGNLNDDPADDIALPDGTVFEQRPLNFSDLYGDFREAWRVKDTDSSLFQFNYDLYAGIEGIDIAQGPDVFFNPNFPVTHVGFQNLSPEAQQLGRDAALAAGYKEEDVFEFEAAAFDFAVMSDIDPSLASGFLQGVETDPGAEKVRIINNTSVISVRPDTGSTLTVNRTGDLSTTEVVTLDICPDDKDPIQVTFAPGETEKTVDIGEADKLTNSDFVIETDPNNPGSTRVRLVNTVDIDLVQDPTTQLLNTISSNATERGNFQVTLLEANSEQLYEIGLYTTDDANGLVDGITPGDAGYTQAVMNRSEVLFSTLANKPNGFEDNGLRNLDLAANQELHFYLVPGGTSDGVRAGQVPPSEVLFASADTLQITESDDGAYNLAWDIEADQQNELVFNMNVAETTSPLGNSIQGQAYGEVLDLRRDILTGQPVQASFEVFREAAYDNTIGFYTVVDEQGGIDITGDGIANIRPGDAGYSQAALSQRINANLTTADQSVATFDIQLLGGTILAPYIVVDDTPDALLDNNIDNDPRIYFAYSGANSDGVDHIRLLGDNTFGFEDLHGGGDRDYNDMIIKASLTV